MSGAQQTCPYCTWYRWQDIPDQMVGDHRDEILEHVARSLQWEWQVHATEMHPAEAVTEECLTTAAFTSWVTGERATSKVDVETPPGEGEGETVGVNPLALTPDQAKQLAESMAGTLATIADGIQNWATQMVPAIRAAAEGATKAVRSAGCQCESSVIGWHLPGAVGCLYRDQAARPLIHTCTCDGFESGHLRGSVGCILQADRKTDDATAKVLGDAAKLQPGARGQQFWRGVYGEVPEADGTDKP